MTAVRGRLISSAFAQEVLPALPEATHPPAAAIRELEAWSRRWTTTSGPVASARGVADAAIVPLLHILGFRIDRRADSANQVILHAMSRDLVLPVVVVPWAHDVARAGREAVRTAIASDARWALCSNGRALRLCDAQHTWTRNYLELDLEAVGTSPDTRRLAWVMLRAETLAQAPPLLERMAEQSAAHGERVCRALAGGVLRSLRLLLVASRTRHPPARQRASALLEQSVTMVFRLLFLLFAEARALVPVWHPIYRDRYTVESVVTALLDARRPRGVWQALQAISRLAHAGCATSDLTVTAFNGRLFSPAEAPAFERPSLSDTVVAEAVLALASRDGHRGRVRIQYRDLDVEQLGAVYEHVLEYQPSGASGDELARTRDVRKGSGTFYTPRSLATHLVRTALAPLVAGRRAEDILSLRVLDPAMGSGAFLVAACRFLAHALEDALVADGTWHAADVTDSDRAALRRQVAQRCLYGVELNPVAVQLARLSLWLATLAADKPLTFLDHHLVAGDSLLGATMADAARQPGRGAGAGRRPAPLPLFDDDGQHEAMAAAIEVRKRLASEPDDSAAVVHDKERRLAAAHAPESVLGRSRQLLDLWCATWFAPRDEAPDRALFGELASFVLDQRSTLLPTALRPWLERASEIAAARRFLHWPVAFPEVFQDAVHSTPGFDAVIGNPPWDMVRGDSGGESERAVRREDARQLGSFVRESGIYRIEAPGHRNRYALFVERALQLLRPGGRLGLVLPAGVVTDVGASALRRHLLSRAAIDTVTGFDNRLGIFPVHRSVRFVLLTGTAGRETSRVDCRFGLTAPDQLEPGRPRSVVLSLSRGLLERISGTDDLGIPELRSAIDLRIVDKITATIPMLGASDGWGLRFGRELNASDDRGLFVARRGTACPGVVLEGKHIEPFRAVTRRARLALRADARHLAPGHARLAYRDIASATNRVTLIAAIVPAQCVTTHTLFCLKTRLSAETQLVLCALMNSFVANYLVRLRVTTHVTVSLVSLLRLPVLAADSAPFKRLARLAKRLGASDEPVEVMEEYANLQALVARLYGLTPDDFAHILGTFPLVPDESRRAAAEAFARLA